MQIFQRAHKGRLWPLLGMLFSVAVQAASVEPAPAVAPDTSAWDTYCSGMLLAETLYKPEKGVEEVERLRQLNRELEERLAAGTLTRADLEKEHIAVFTGERLTDHVGQPFPFEKVLFPHAFTGAYFPLGKGGKQPHLPNFQMKAMLMGGIGFEISIAASMRELGGTLVNGSETKMPNGQVARFLSVLVDPPLNGLGEHAPFAFGHPKAVVEVLRHIHIAMEVLYPNRPTGIFGRSQGGINALEYAHTFPKDVAFVVAANPSTNKPDIIRDVIESHENMARPENIKAAQEKGFSCTFHYRSWYAHKVYTSQYTAEDLPSPVPTLLLLGQHDESYPAAKYQPLWRHWARVQPDHRKVLFYNGYHNPWSRGGRKENSTVLKYQHIWDEAMALQRGFLADVLKMQ